MWGPSLPESTKCFFSLARALCPLLDFVHGAMELFSPKIKRTSACLCPDTCVRVRTALNSHRKFGFVSKR